MSNFNSSPSFSTPTTEVDSWDLPASLSSIDTSWDNPTAFQSSTEMQVTESRGIRIKRSLGRFATKETFGVGGTVSSAIESSNKIVDTAATIRNTRAFSKMEDKYKTAKTAGKVIDTVSMVSSVARNYDTVAGGVQSFGSSKEEIKENAKVFAKETAIEAAKAAGIAALEATGEAVGITKEGEHITVQKRKMGAAAIKIAIAATGGGMAAIKGDLIAISTAAATASMNAVGNSVQSLGVNASPQAAW